MSEYFARHFTIACLALAIFALYFLMLFAAWKSRHRGWFFAMLAGLPFGIGFVLAAVYRMSVYEGPRAWRRQRLLRRRERARQRRQQRRQERLRQREERERKKVQRPLRRRLRSVSRNGRARGSRSGSAYRERP